MKPLRRGGSRPAHGPAGEPDKTDARRGLRLENVVRDLAARRPVLLFVTGFVVIVAAYYAMSEMAWYRDGFFPAYLRMIAGVSGWLLNLAGAGVTVSGDNINSAVGGVSIRHGCDATEPIVFLIAAVVAFPSAWRAKLVAVLVGIPFLWIMNLVRIITLYYASVHVPTWFEPLHVQVWQPVFILMVVGLWAVWALRLTRQPISAPTDDLRARAGRSEP